MAEPPKSVDERTALLASGKAIKDGTIESPNAATQGDNVRSTSPSGAAPEELSTSQLVLIIGSGYLGIMLAALDGTMVATLTASISGTFNSLSLLAWLTSSYFIATSILQPLAGKLTDIYGRRAGLIFCNVMFCIGNLICGLAKSEATIILGRVVAGLGGGGLNAIPLFVTNDLVPLRKRGVWQGFNNISYGIGSGLGGIFGGRINDALSWRWAFILIVPFTLISLTLVVCFLNMPTKDIDEFDVNEKWKRIDFLGSMTLTAAIVLLCTGLNAGGNTVPWNHPLVVVSLPVSAILLIAFVYIEAKVAVEPVIPVGMFFNRTVVAACLTNWFFSMAQVALTIYSPLYFQVKGASATLAGLFLVPTSVGAAVGGILTGYIMRALGKYYLLNIVIQLMFLLPLGLTMRLTLDSSNILPVFYFFSTGFAYAGKLTVTVTALIAAVEQKQQAVVTSAAYAFRGTGSTIGISLCSLVFQNVLQGGLWDRFGRAKNAADLISRLRDSLGGIETLPTSQLRREAQEIYMKALSGVFATIFGMAVIGTIASLFMKEYTLHKDLGRRRS